MSSLLQTVVVLLSVRTSELQRFENVISTDVGGDHLQLDARINNVQGHSRC